MLLRNDQEDENLEQRKQQMEKDEIKSPRRKTETETAAPGNVQSDTARESKVNENHNAS